MSNQDFTRPICLKPVNCGRSIQCDICDLWIHQSRCSGLSLPQFEAFCVPNSDSWYCPKCINLTLPFPTEAAPQVCNSVTPGNNLSDDLRSLFSDFNEVVTGIDSSSDEDDCEIKFQSNSCSYVNCTEFNSIFSKTPTNLSAFHLNIASNPKHFDEFRTLLAQLDCKFSFIGLSETKNVFLSKFKISKFRDTQNFLHPLSQQLVVYHFISLTRFLVNLELTFVSLFIKLVTLRPHLLRLTYQIPQTLLLVLYTATRVCLANYSTQTF